MCRTKCSFCRRFFKMFLPCLNAFVKLLRPDSGEKKQGSTKNIVLSLFDSADDESGYAAATSVVDDTNVRLSF